MPRNETDLTGKVFNKLTVTGLSHRDNGCIWNCKCDCGNNTTARTGALNRGSKKSCGCLLKSKRQTVFPGQRFTHLFVEKLDHTGRQGGKYWLCKCDCGSSKVIPNGSLSTGRTKSCGCKSSELRGNLHGEIWLSFWNNKKYDANTRNLEFTVSREQAWQKFLDQNKQCALSGVTIVFGKRYSKDETTASMDRIDSSVGYTPENIQWVHKRINFMKSNLSDEELLTWCQRVVSHSIA